MTIKIHSISKADLSQINSISPTAAGMTSSSGMTISHYSYCDFSADVTLPYSIEVVDNHVPYIKDVDYCIAIKEKENLIGVGVNAQTIKDIGDDVGKYTYSNCSPSRTLDIPIGFKEFYNAKQ